jgi:two-component system NtrC family response regulator
MDQTGNPADAPALLALVPTTEREALARCVRESGLQLVAVRTLTSLFSALADHSFVATVLSLSTDSVDETIARRIGDEARSGTLLLSGPRVTLDGALLMERVGAVALLREPLDAAEVREHLEHILDEGEQTPLPPPSGDETDAPVLVGSGRSMGRVLQVLARVAPTPSTVLLTGESGTGKEVAARVLHWASPRRDRPFVAVNCAAIPEHLLESELFGHERGAFTGAVARRVGRFERANGGTLFLDEIGDMSPVLQAKILRVLEERRLERVGGEESVEVDVRIVAATNQDLRARIASGEFREDLYYRLAVVELSLPPLRERGSDIRDLALHFAEHFARRYDRRISGITEEALRRLESATWPGNVRELRNVMDRAILLASGDVIRAGELRLGAGAPRASALGAEAGFYPATLSMAEVEAAHIQRVLDAQGGHMGHAAEVLGIHRNTLTRKVQEYGIARAAEGDES